MIRSEELRFPLSWTDQYEPYITTTVFETVEPFRTFPDAQVQLSCRGSPLTTQGRWIHGPDENPLPAEFVEASVHLSNHSIRVSTMHYQGLNFTSSLLDISRNEGLLSAFDSFMITPTSFIIDPTNPEMECEEGQSLFEFQAHRTDDFRIWYFTNAISGETVNFATHHEIGLHTGAYFSLISTISDIARERGLGTSFGRNGDWIIHDCNIDELDSVLPVFRYGLSNNQTSNQFEISLSGKDYLRPYFPEIGFEESVPNACRVAVTSWSYHVPLYVGSPLFRKYAVSFDKATNTGKICKAAVRL